MLCEWKLDNGQGDRLALTALSLKKILRIFLIFEAIYSTVLVELENTTNIWRTYHRNTGCPITSLLRLTQRCRGTIIQPKREGKRAMKGPRHARMPKNLRVSESDQSNQSKSETTRQRTGTKQGPETNHRRRAEV